MSAQHGAATLLAALVTSAAAAQTGVLYRGLTHTSVGDVAIVLDPNDSLRIDGAMNGNDGTTIALGDAEFWAGRLAAFDTSAPTGSSIDVIARSSSIAADLARIRFIDAGASLDLSVEYPFLAGATLHVELLDGTTVVDQADLPMGVIAKLPSTVVRVDPIRDSATRKRGALDFPSGAMVTLAGGAPHTATRLTFSVQDPQDMDAVNTIDVLGNGIDRIRIGDEQLGKFQFEHRALGSLELRASGVCPSCTLTLGNIGASGDELQIEFPPAASFTWEFDASSMSNWPFFGSLTTACSGRVNGIDASPISEVTLLDVGTSVEVFADFTAIGSFSVTARLYLDGTLVASEPSITTPIVALFPGQSGPTAQTVFAPGANLEHVGVATRSGHMFRWPNPVSVTLTGGPTAIGDQLVLFAEMASSTTDSITSTQTPPIDLPDVILIGEHVEPECPGDTNGDDVIDLFDLSTLLSNFGTTEGMTAADGDTDGDHDVDLADLSTLLSNYGDDCD